MVIGRCVVQGGAFGGVTHIDHRGQHVVVHLDQFSSVLSLLKRFGHHHHHMVAHIAHFALRQDGVRWFFHRLPTGVGDQPTAWQAIHIVASHILTIINTHHTWRGHCGFFVDAFDRCMRMR